jgi:hypothetical protein
VSFGSGRHYEVHGHLGVVVADHGGDDARPVLVVLMVVVELG